MNKINRIISDVRLKSNVDNFTFNLEKALEDMVNDIIEDVRTYKTPIGGITKTNIDDIGGTKSVVNWCSFHQESIANDLSEKYLKD